MTYRTLGGSDIRVSAVALGCMTLGTDPAGARSIIWRALDLGVTLFDTADLYDRGLNEEIVGEALRGLREKVVLSTKVGNRWRPDASGWDWDPSETYILQQAHESLRRLGTDYIDLYQLHGGTIDDPTEETVRAFERLAKQGLIRAWGISSIRPDVVRRFASMVGTEPERTPANQASFLTSEMVQYSVIDRRPEEEILATARAAGMGVLVRGALASGMLAGSIGGMTARPGPAKPAADYLGLTTPEVQAAQDALRSVAGSDQKMTETSIRFVLSNLAVTAAVVGASSEAQVEANVAAADAPPLSDADQRALRTAVRQIRYTSHR